VIIDEKDGGAFSMDSLVFYLFSKASQEIQKASGMIARGYFA